MLRYAWYSKRKVDLHAFPSEFSGNVSWCTNQRKFNGMYFLSKYTTRYFSIEIDFPSVRKSYFFVPFHTFRSICRSVFSFSLSLSLSLSSSGYTAYVFSSKDRLIGGWKMQGQVWLRGEILVVLVLVSAKRQNLATGSKCRVGWHVSPCSFNSFLIGGNKRTST